jgi:hypothetical protein
MRSDPDGVAYRERHGGPLMDLQRLSQTIVEPSGWPLMCQIQGRLA